MMTKNSCQQIEEHARKHELVFSIGGSYSDNIYFGATIGIPIIDYYEISNYKENNFADTINELEAFQFNEDLVVYGSCINIKIGTIIRAFEQIKLGAALHSPTLYTMEETYSTDLSTGFLFLVLFLVFLFLFFILSMYLFLLK